MKILTLITLMACGMIMSAHGQSFTNFVNESVPDGKGDITVSYNLHSHQTISTPLEIYVDLTVFGAADVTSLEGTIQHKGVTYDFFSFGNDVKSGQYVFPTSDFIGQDGEGSWNLTLTDDLKNGGCVELNSWGIASVPEPSSAAIILLGFASLILIQRKNFLHEKN